MAYKIYLKADYKPEIRWTEDRPWYRRAGIHGAVLSGLVLASTAVIISAMAPSARPLAMDPPPVAAPLPAAPVMEAAALPVEQDPVPAAAEYTSIDPVPAAVLDAPPPEPVSAGTWKKIKVAAGDNLSLIFDRLKISPAVLYQVMNAGGEEARSLRALMPGQELRFHLVDGDLQALEYDRDLVTTLRVGRETGAYTSAILKTELDKSVLAASSVIDSSLFLAGQKAGLSDNLIMQLVAIYGWDIDFALDIRKGDAFKLIYEQQYKAGVKVGEGPILAAEFSNRGRAYRAVRYRLPDGSYDYFSDEGASMRKAFLRTPLNFTRISSGFSLNRRHPVLNKIRAHKGVDYAAPSGTPVKAAGDGTIVSIGTNGGYGRTVVIKHGGTYSTLYAHLSRYAQGMKKGTRVRQGQVVAYVGSSGLATGPHLHYEFRVNGAHRNPLTVSLPKAESIPAELLPGFLEQTSAVLAQLDRQEGEGPLMIALRDENPLEPEKFPENY